MTNKVVKKVGGTIEFYYNLTDFARSQSAAALEDAIEALSKPGLVRFRFLFDDKRVVTGTVLSVEPTPNGGIYKITMVDVEVEQGVVN